MLTTLLSQSVGGEERGIERERTREKLRQRDKDGEGEREPL